MTELWPLPDDPLIPEVLTVVESEGLAARYRTLDRAPQFPRAEFRALGRGRLLGLTVPEAEGGRGLTAARAAVLLYRLAYAAGTTFAKLALQPEFSSVLGEHGSPALRERWYAPLLRGELLVGNQVTEPEAGSDATALSLLAEPVADGFELTGTKSEAAFAADADAAIVYARRPGSIRADGISAFLVPQQLPGIHREVDPLDLGEHWQRRGRVQYNRVRVPDDHRIGEEGAAFGYLRHELDRERGLLAAVYLGVARASWDETVQDVGARTAFGRRLADQQAVAHPLVEDGADLEADWLLTLRALSRLDAGEDSGAATAMAKVRASRTALAVLDHCIQFHGGAGYSARLPHEQRWRDVRSGGIAHGPSEVLRSVAARRLWPRAGGQ